MRILIITDDKCEDSEVLYPYYRIQEEGWDVDIAAMTKKTVQAKFHSLIETDRAVAELLPEDYDGLVLPGGSAPEKLRLNPDVLRISREIFRAGKPVAAICHGAQVLMSAGVLNGYTATCYPGVQDDLKNCGAAFRDEAVVVDRNLVTSRRPVDLPYFMREFVKLCKQ